MAAPDSRDWTYLPVERPETEVLYREYLAKFSGSADPLHFAIMGINTGQAIGTVALIRIDPVNGVIEVGSITYSPPRKRPELPLRPCTCSHVWCSMGSAFGATSGDVTA